MSGELPAPPSDNPEQLSRTLVSCQIICERDAERVTLRVQACVDAATADLRAKLRRYEFSESEQVEEEKGTFAKEINAAEPSTIDEEGEDRTVSDAEMKLLYARYELALKLVGERHEKYPLVSLVNWLLGFRDRLGPAEQRIKLLTGKNEALEREVLLARSGHESAKTAFDMNMTSRRAEIIALRDALQGMIAVPTERTFPETGEVITCRYAPETLKAAIKAFKATSGYDGMVVMTADQYAKHMENAGPYASNQFALELGEMERFKKRLEWLGNPKSKFVYTISPNGSCNVFDKNRRILIKIYPNIAAAVDAEMERQKP